jgi:hypothetical protein
METQVTVQRCVHAAHTGSTGGWDIVNWVYAQEARLPVPAGVPRDAEYHHGYVNGVQHWVYTTRATFSPGRCSSPICTASEP